MYQWQGIERFGFREHCTQEWRVQDSPGVDCRVNVLDCVPLTVPNNRVSPSVVCRELLITMGPGFHGQGINLEKKESERGLPRYLPFRKDVCAWLKTPLR
jgi:hypothetical protein